MAKLDSFSMRAGINNEYDSQIFDRLLEYCDRLGIQIQTIQINNQLVIQFVGRQGNLIELRNYLEEAKNNVS